MDARRKPQTILIVEDDPNIAELITWALDDAGFDVLTAPTIAEAREILAREQPDLLVADLLLPDGLGSDLVRSTRDGSTWAQVATLLMSAHPRATEHALFSGADACLPKPFDLDEFYQVVDRLLFSSAA